MAADLQRQRRSSSGRTAASLCETQAGGTRERTRSPIQLSSEHLVRARKGLPLTPVLEECGAIMSRRSCCGSPQSFGCPSPTASGTDTAPSSAGADPYHRAGRPHDPHRYCGAASRRGGRNLLRHITNIVKHTPRARKRSLTITAKPCVPRSSCRLPTPAGMDAKRCAGSSAIFRKSDGHGPGLTIAKRNVELSDGSIGALRAGKGGGDDRAADGTGRRMGVREKSQEKRAREERAKTEPGTEAKNKDTLS